MKIELLRGLILGQSHQEGAQPYLSQAMRARRVHEVAQKTGMPDFLPNHPNGLKGAELLRSVGDGCEIIAINNQVGNVLKQMNTL